MRIISGKYKGRHFDIPRNFKARPTTDFAKENLFNILLNYTDFEECEALDLFSGTGSISLELLSRGCTSVTSVEMDQLHYSHLIKVAFESTEALQDFINNMVAVNPQTLAENLLGKAVELCGGARDDMTVIVAKVFRAH